MRCFSLTTFKMMSVSFTRLIVLCLGLDCFVCTLLALCFLELLISIFIEFGQYETVFLHIFFLIYLSFLSFRSPHCPCVGTWYIWRFITGLWGFFHFCSIFFSLLFWLDKSYCYIFKFYLLLYISLLILLSFQICRWVISREVSF